MRSALIVGAGIGGLSAAIALRQAGWNIRLFERAAFPPPEVLGGPTVVALRQALHGALLDAVGMDAIALGCNVTGLPPRVLA